VNGPPARRPAFTLCAPCGPATTLEATAYWDASGLDQLLFGEWPFAVGQRGKLIPDVNTALDDWPCLADVLRQGSLRASGGWLLLLTAEALPSTALIQALIGFLSTEPKPQLIFGRGWRVGAERWTLLRNLGPDPQQENAIQEALRQEGSLDPPGVVSWMLLPRQTLLSAPADLSAELQSAAPWLTRRATESGWPVLEATWVGPLLRPRAMNPPLLASARRWIRSDGALPNRGQSRPRLSFLLVGDSDRMRQRVDQLLPAATLPWDVVVRQVTATASSDDIIAAWNDASLEAQADLVWPLWNRVPALGSILTLLRCFEASWVDLVSTAFRLGGLSVPANDPTRLLPGTLVLRHDWLKLLGGLPTGLTPEKSLILFRQNCSTRGATVHPLPLELFAE